MQCTDLYRFEESRVMREQAARFFFPVIWVTAASDDWVCAPRSLLPRGSADISSSQSIKNKTVASHIRICIYVYIYMYVILYSYPICVER